MKLQSLPASSSIDVSALSRLFGETTNSYKYLFFYAIFNKMRNLETTKIKLHELAEDMLAFAWYPHVFFKLSFGVQDQVAGVLDLLNFSLDGQMAGSEVAEKSLRSAVTIQGKNIGARELLRYVPYRLLTVFFESELRRQTDQRKNSLIDIFANDFFSQKKPFYRFCSKGGKVYLEFHSSWQIYFSENYSVVYGWFCWEWLKYLQARNPNIPSIQNKLFPPTHRIPMSIQKKYWREIISNYELTCIFSGETLSKNNYALDHFIPWSFVCHDRLWNLLPIKITANSAKKNHIPDELYLNQFIEMQIRGLELSKDILPENQWKKITESFVADLQLEYDELFDLEIVSNAYRRVIPPLMLLAGNSGFQTNWRYH